MFSRLCFSRVLNCLMVLKSSFSLIILRQKRSNLPKIWLGLKSNCLALGTFWRRSFVNSYYFTYASWRSRQFWRVAMSSSAGYCSWSQSRVSSTTAAFLVEAWFEPASWPNGVCPSLILRKLMMLYLQLAIIWLVILMKRPVILSLVL